VYLSVALVLFVVSVEIYQKDVTSKSKNRKIPCFFCDNIVFNMPRHLSRQHKDEIEVANAIKAKEKGNPLPFLKLAAYGIFNHNVNVLIDKKGILFVSRSSEKPHYVEDYLPCSYCQVFVIKRELYRHCNRCKLRNSDHDRKYAADGRLLLDGALYTDNTSLEPLARQVFAKMHNDKRTKVARNDSSIARFGASLLRKLGPKRANDIAQRMRQLARVSMKLAKRSGIKKRWFCYLDEFLSGNKFDELIDAICDECEAYEDKAGRTLFKNPNFALKLGHSLLKMAKLKLGAAIRSRNAQAKLQAEEFISLHGSDFTDLIATPAHASVKLMSRKLDDFPDAADLVKLKDYQIEISRKLCLSLTAKPSDAEWRLLAETTMSRLLVYNARRGSEVADLRVSEYRARTNFVHSNVNDNLSAEDLQLVKR
jgi:hypothetical protein